MQEYRFTLETYDRTKQNRYACPNCGKQKEFTRYIDRTGEITFPDYVGKCNRVNKCGYHYTPSMYFKEHPEEKARLPNVGTRTFVPSVPVQPEPPSFIDSEVMLKTCTHYEQNNFFHFLCQHFGRSSSLRLMEKYHVGSAKKWGHSTVFWQIDAEGRVHAGKIMLYHAETGHRVKDPHPLVSWVHTELRLNDFRLDQCFFGEHLLADSQKPVAIVESEKTAIIASFYIPEYIWLATGGKNGCFNERHLHPLLGRNVVLFPDIGMMDEWKKRAEEMIRKGIHVVISDYLEKNATEDERQDGYDIADYLLKLKTGEAVLQSMIRKNPVLQKLVDALDLEVIDYAAS